MTSEAKILQPPEGVEGAAVWLARVIDWAHQRGATDVHFLPIENEARLWVRLDGELRELTPYDLSIHERMISRLKVLGRCTDYAGELIQEGRFALDGNAAKGEARLSILPTLRGEKAVVRLLAGGEKLRPLAQLGFDDALQEALRTATERPQGMILAVGPSGCGKSTALYAMLHNLQQRAGQPVSIVTIEDPVEQTVPLAAQISAEPTRGLGIAEILRAVLRQDPEVIMVGEIRDPETSQAAMQAALTGHRLLSSMHTLNAAEALVRLQQMGSPPFVISSALAGVLNLRLVRLLCPECKTSLPATESELALLPEAATWPEPLLAQSSGCDECVGGGHRGRSGVGEWLTPTPETADSLQARGTAAELARTLIVEAGARPTLLKLMREQRSSLAEVRRLTGLTSSLSEKERLSS